MFEFLKETVPIGLVFIVSFIVLALSIFYMYKHSLVSWVGLLLGVIILLASFAIVGFTYFDLQAMFSKGEASKGESSKGEASLA